VRAGLLSAVDVRRVDAADTDDDTDADTDDDARGVQVAR
jgi:hypothetical protein